jgi:hypothetical protein
MGARRGASLVALLSLVLAFVALPRATQAAGVVGSGTPASCTQAALLAALKKGGSVTFNCGGPFTFDLTTRLVISDDTKIYGADKITLRANNANNWSGVFDILAGVSVTLADLTLKGGGSQENVCVVSDGNLLIKSSTIINCNGIGDGGAIANSGTLAIIDSTLSGNSAGHFGGAIFNWHGTVAITDSTLSGNSAGSGSAIFNYNLGTVAITNTTLSGNSADFGGAITNEGMLTITDTTLSGNSADSGGAIYNESTLAITGSTIIGNSADGGGAIFNHASGSITAFSNNVVSDNSAGSGGAIYNSGVLAVTNTTLSGNSAANGGGGAIYNRVNASITAFSNNVVSDNSTEGNGGGIENLGTIAAIDSSTFQDNHATGELIPGGYGGAIYSSGTIGELTTSTFSRNVAWSGGGLFYDTGYVHGQLDITNSTFSGNQGVFGGALAAFGDDDVVNISSSTFAGNQGASGGAVQLYTAAHITGSTFSANSATGYGGALYIQSWGRSVTVVNSTFSGNQAEIGGAIANGSGGLNDGGHLTLTNSTLAGNAATTGGALLNDRVTTVANTILAGSTAGGNCSGLPVSSAGHNLSDDLSCQSGLSAAGDLNGIDPLLSPLADNGGPTQTHALKPASPAIDGGDDAICAAKPVENRDQRNEVRPNGLHCDIGAYEGVIPT